MASRSPSSPTSAAATISGWCRPPADGHAAHHQRSAPVPPVWSPDGNWIAYTSDHDGDEQWDIFMVSPKTGDVVNLTTSPESAESRPGLVARRPARSPTPQSRRPASYEIELMDIATRHVTHVTTNTPKELSNVRRSSRTTASSSSTPSRTRRGKDSNIFVADLASGKSTNLTPHEGATHYFATDLSPDGKTRLDHLRRAQWLRQCRTARYRIEEDRTGSRTTSGRSKPEAFRPTASR